MITYKRPKAAAAKLAISLDELMARCERGEIWCPRCKAWKDAEAHFYRHKNTPTGYTSACRECFNKRPYKTAIVRYKRCDYCGNGLGRGGGREVRLEGRTYQVHDTCVDRAREYVYGEPVRDPVWEV